MSTRNQFDDAEWHDCMVHGIEFFSEGFQSEIRLDIDLITDWSSCCEGFFKVAPVFLTFSDVTDLKVNIDWGNSGFRNSLSGIFIVSAVRKEISTVLKIEHYYEWELIFNNGGVVAFGASSFSQVIRKEPVLVDRQYLYEIERE